MEEVLALLPTAVKAVAAAVPVVEKVDAATRVNVYCEAQPGSERASEPEFFQKPREMKLKPNNTVRRR